MTMVLFPIAVFVVLAGVALIVVVRLFRSQSPSSRRGRRDSVDSDPMPIWPVDGGMLASSANHDQSYDHRSCAGDSAASDEPSWSREDSDCGRSSFDSDSDSSSDSGGGSDGGGGGD